MNGVGSIDATDEKLMIDPPPDRASSGIMCLQPRNTPVLFTANMRSQSSRGACSGSFGTSGSPSMPALFTRMCSAPSRAAMSVASADQPASSLTSCSTKRAPIAAATLAPPVALRSDISRRAPSCARRWATAAPRPWAAPVTSATLPVNRSVMRREDPRHCWRAAIAGSTQAADLGGLRYRRCRRLVRELPGKWQPGQVRRNA